jgi:hypothetical protein
MRCGVRAAVVGVALLCAATACADFSAPEDPTFGLPDVVVAQPSFASDVQPLFDKRCAVGGCHTRVAEKGGLALDPAVSYDELVGIAAVTSGNTYLRIAPGNAADSWLVRRIQQDPAPRNGLTRMPLAATPLTSNQIATIVNWVEQGALRN